MLRRIPRQVSWTAVVVASALAPVGGLGVRIAHENWPPVFSRATSFAGPRERPARSPSGRFWRRFVAAWSPPVGESRSCARLP